MQYFPADSSQTRASSTMSAQQPTGSNVQLTSKEGETIEGMQKWANIRRQRREAAGFSAEGMGDRPIKSKSR
jgi:hypothetical protein